MKRIDLLRMAVFSLVILFAPVMLFPTTGAAQTLPPENHTVYLIGNLSRSGMFPLLAYTTVANDLFHAETWYSAVYGIGPVGLAVDEINENLFVSYEYWDSIDVFDATDATPLGTIRLVGTSDLAGMVVHQGRGHLYVVDRGQSDVFVYDTTTFQQIDHWNLSTGAWGIDLLKGRDILFVADTSNTVRWYDIDTHFELDSFTQQYGATSIAVTDYPELLVFTQDWYSYSFSNYLTKYYVDSASEEHVLTGSNNNGVTLNPAQELAYVASDNNVHVIDTDLMTIVRTISVNPLWIPTDILASNVVFGSIVHKTCPSHPNGKFRKGDQVSFEIYIQNRHILPIHTMALKDVYDNTQLSFVSASIPPDDTTDDGQLDWSNLIAQNGADLQTGEFMTFTLDFQVLEDCSDILEGVNIATVFNITDDSDTSLEDALGEFDYIIDCNCLSNLDCDDGVFCNGSEICNRDGTCESPGNPCPLDDGQFCNGTETDVCDEALDECEHVDPPCEDDGQWCNGTEVCNEDIDVCSNPGPPCTNDGQFCNGDETCNEQAQECEHSGDPCTADEECNESSDECSATDLGDDDDDDTGGEKDLWPDGKVTGGCCG